MAREPDVALLIMAPGSFVDKHKLAHTKKDLHTQDFKSKDPFLRDRYVFETKIEKLESIRKKRPKFAHEQISLYTHTNG